jgi:hypothetical protein
MGAIPLLFVTTIYISVFAYIIASTQIDTLREDWNTKRCTLMGMMLASYIPDPTVNSSQFSSENFQFCLHELVDSSISLLMVPIMGVLSAQVTAANTTNSSINNLRNSAATDLANPFNNLMNIAWKRFGYIMSQMLRVMYKINSSFQRIFGITVASLFAGLSTFKAINNAYNLLIKVCIIVLIIIISMLFLIFFAIAPILATVIIPVIVAISATEYSNQMGGVSTGSFANCVEPGTLVKCKRGWVPVEEIRVGDELANGRVTGILQGEGGPCVLIHSIKISSTHIVYDIWKKAWVFAKDHSDAIGCTYPPKQVYSLTTSSRRWQIKSVQEEKEVLLRDWTHLPNDAGADFLAEDLVHKFLGGHTPLITSIGLGLFGPKSMVWKEGTGQVTLDSINIGDRIKDGDAMTKVTATYISDQLGNASGPNASAWIYINGAWSHPIMHNESEDLYRMNIITESGSFTLNAEKVRDLSEVGPNDLQEVEDFLLSLLNSRNE